MLAPVSDFRKDLASSSEEQQCTVLSVCTVELLFREREDSGMKAGLFRFSYTSSFRPPDFIRCWAKDGYQREQKVWGEESSGIALGGGSVLHHR